MIDPLVTAARTWADAPALADATGTRTWSELLEDATRLAASLGVRPSDRVALLAADRAATVVAIHATRLAGGVLVPLHRRLAVPELAAQLLASRARLVLHDADHAGMVATLRRHAASLRSMSIDLVTDAKTRRRPVDRVVPGVVVHTSGTTTAPRAALLDHVALMASALAWDTFLESTADDHWLAALPLSHVAGLGMVLRPLLTGARLTVHDRYEPDAVRAALAEEAITLLSLVPTQLARLIDAGPVHAPRLRALLLGGGPVPPALVGRALDAGLPVVATYGLTEAASGVTALPAPEASMAPGSVGRPLPGITLRVVDRRDQDVAPGQTGSILVGGPTLFSGYDDDPEATRAALGDGWLRTRDMGTLDADGRLWVLDRQDELIISGGENVSPVEVETVIRAHPAVADVAVVGRPDAEWGAVPIAAIVARSGLAAPTSDEVRAFARDRLAGYKLPAEVHIVAGIPRTASGKVLRREVAALVGVGDRQVPGASVDRYLDRPDGARIHVATQGSGATLVLLHATLSNAGELRALTTELGTTYRVLAVDRRSAGASTMPPDDDGGPVDVALHVEDVGAVLDAFAPDERVLLVGHSFGGCVALELASRQPGRVAGTWVYEPPYLPLLEGGDGSGPDLRTLGERIAGLARDEGPEAAALAFLDAVRGPGTAARLPSSARKRLAAEGRSAVADAALLGLDPSALAAIAAPVAVALGGRSGAPYPAIAGRLAAVIPTLEVVRLAELGHGGPVSRPSVVAAAIRGFARRAAAWPALPEVPR